jgi:hypothetical protein
MGNARNSIAALALVLSGAAHAGQPVLQRGYDADVSGANLTEVILNTSNVAPATFGRAFNLPVDDRVYAQPLYVPGVAIPNQGTHNVVYVATMSDTLYAFDADSGAQLWSVNFATSLGTTAVAFANFTFAGNANIVGNLGILSTPVIDPSTNILYLVACTLENGTMAYRLHAVNIGTGTEPYANALISGSYGGVTFDAPHQTQRVSLALSGNQVVFGFGAVEAESDNVGGYVGWVMAYNKTTLARSGIFATVTTGTKGGGVWQSGRPPVVDSSGYVYVFVGNGYTSGYDGVQNFSESVLKLDPAHGLNLVDWFTPSNWSAMDADDLDLTSSGPMLIPGTSLIAGGGKTGVLYVLNTANLGHFSASNSGVVQAEPISVSSLRGGPVYWQRSPANGGPLLYDWGTNDWVKAYAFGGTTFASTPSSQGSGTQIYPGGILAISANGATPGSGVLWATVAASGNVYNDPTDPGVLHAYDAGDVSTELWNSTMNSARDNFGSFAKFVPPLVANGKVYVATFSNQVAVYGLFSSYTASPASLTFGNQLTNAASSSMSVTVTNTGKVALPITSITLSTSGSHPFSQTNNCGTSIAVGGGCTINVVFNPASAGSAAATLSVCVGNGVATQTVALSGTGVVPTYTTSPMSLAFGNQLANAASTPKFVTVTNTGTVALPITGIALSTSSPQPFSQTNTCGSSVAIGASCIISVVFDPAPAGSVTAALSVYVGNGAAAQTVALSGTGSVPSYTASSMSVAFGNQMTNVASTPKSVTLTNTGVVALPITGIALSSSGAQPFSETNTCGTTLAIGAVCTIGIVFDPASAGSNTAALNVNVTGRPLAISVSGDGDFAVALTESSQGVTAGVPVTLTWSSTPGAACTASGGNMADNWTGSLGASGSRPVTEVSPGTYEYGLNCVAQGINAAATVTAAVTLPTVTLSAAPSSITVGKSVTLTWDSSNTAACVGGGGQSNDGWAGTKSASGTAIVTPNAAGTITYTMDCSAGPKSVQATSQVIASSPTSSPSSPPITSSGGGALDTISLLSLLTMFGLQQRRRFLRTVP